ncbi:hypothetical protein F0562_010429 [Nyssa sinensis]|uniref:Uncharacterized protein n=1 Tax=Nyssa sinensis TaxID=561372 RepID=A0A5J5A0Z6_9ASTE|nr:hypothetical protein F0562_010429 [Nyssa sinensis]
MFETLNRTEILGKLISLHSTPSRLGRFSFPFLKTDLERIRGEKKGIQQVLTNHKKQSCLQFQSGQKSKRKRKQTTTISRSLPTLQLPGLDDLKNRQETVVQINS